MKTISVKIEIELKYDPKFPYQLTLSGPQGYVQGEGGEIYFSEIDGKSVSCFGEIKSIFPGKCSLCNSVKGEVWLDSCGQFETKEFDGRKIEMEYSETWGEEDGEEYWIEDGVRNVVLV